MDERLLEAQTQEIARRMLARARELPGGRASWVDRVFVDRIMGDEGTKARLFRFVDVLPSLAGSRQVGRHLREYLRPQLSRLPWPLKLAVSGLADNAAAGPVVAAAARAGARRMARRFIAAADMAGAPAAALALRQRGLGFSIDLLGEAVLSEAEADTYQRQYLELIASLCDAADQWPAAPRIDERPGGRVPRVNVSIKLSGLFSQMDGIDPRGGVEAVLYRLRPILRLARRRGALINVDMEQHALKDLTLEIFRRVLDEEEFRTWGDVGVAVQAYLTSCERDLRGLAQWARSRGTGVWVRLVKGAYWDYETVIAAQNGWELPVFAQKAQTDANFEAQTAFLLENSDVLRPAIATHNMRSIARAMALARQMGLADGAVEFQMLYGMAESEKAALVEAGQRVRVYAPVGELLPGMAYLVRRLLENTSNESFLRAGFAHRVPEERLLMNPRDLIVKERPAAAKGEFINEPVSDFADAEARGAMERALSEVVRQLDQSYAPVVGGRRLATAAAIESVNPSHMRQVVGRAGRATAGQAAETVETAKRAFEGWRDTPAAKRADCLFAAARIMRRRRFELAAWEVYETAHTWREADADVAESIDYLEYYARKMLQLVGPRRRDVPGEENEYFYEGRGVAVVIAPWNFPLAILCGMSCAALVAGNTVIMKPAEQSAVVGAKLMEIFEQAGFGAGVVNYLPGVGSEIGPVLVSHPDVATVAFTGSRGVGLSIVEQAGRTAAGQDHVKRVIAEMGGKNAIIVDDDADLDEAIRGTVASAFGYAGQKCSACSRVIVLSGVYDAFVARLIEATRSLKIGPAEDPATMVNPLIDDEARRRVLDFVARGKATAQLALTSSVGPLAEEGFYVGPHIFVDVPADSVLAREEIFGPVLAVMHAGDLDAALGLANGVSYALTGGIYSRSPGNIARARREFRVGNLYVNRKITGAMVDRQPFGGFKLSGIGTKAGGPDYLQQFLLPRTVTENTLRHGFAPGEGENQG